MGQEYSYAIICEGEKELDMIFPHASDKKINKILKDYIIVATWNGWGDSGIRVVRVRKKNEND